MNLIRNFQISFGRTSTNLAERPPARFRHFRMIHSEYYNATQSKLTSNSGRRDLGHWYTQECHKLGIAPENQLAEALSRQTGDGRIQLNAVFRLGNFGNEHITAVYHAFFNGEEGWRRLHKLSADGNGISSAGMRHINGLLVLNPGLTTLELSHNPIGDEGVHTLCQALIPPRNPAYPRVQLQRLNLSDCGISDFGASRIAEMLKRNTALRVVELQTTGVSAGHPTLPDDLVDNPALADFVAGLEADLTAERQVSLSSQASRPRSGALSHANDIGPVGATALAQALSVNRSIQSLNLLGNAIGHEGFKNIVTHATGHTSLRSLGLSVFHRPHGWTHGEFYGANSPPGYPYARLIELLRMTPGLQRLDFDWVLVGPLRQVARPRCHVLDHTVDFTSGVPSYLPKDARLALEEASPRPIPLSVPDSPARGVQTTPPPRQSGLSPEGAAELEPLVVAARQRTAEMNQAIQRSASQSTVPPDTGSDGAVSPPSPVAVHTPELTLQHLRHSLLSSMSKPDLRVHADSLELSSPVFRFSETVGPPTKGYAPPRNQTPPAKLGQGTASIATESKTMVDDIVKLEKAHKAEIDLLQKQHETELRRASSGPRAELARLAETVAGLQQTETMLRQKVQDKDEEIEQLKDMHRTMAEDVDKRISKAVADAETAMAARMAEAAKEFKEELAAVRADMATVSEKYAAAERIAAELRAENSRLSAALLEQQRVADDRKAQEAEAKAADARKAKEAAEAEARQKALAAEKERSRWADREAAIQQSETRYAESRSQRQRTQKKQLERKLSSAKSLIHRLSDAGDSDASTTSTASIPVTRKSAKERLAEIRAKARARGAARERALSRESLLSRSQVGSDSEGLPGSLSGISGLKY
ncbi:Leucine Rich repeat [Carpediemonas membranifera]|uniref:Leucine Rich repeat n=1 Tax=Carpediemonas membranifera TaxID=201153 RepID=A0A8J6DZF8_9EUKA|nr:Leucine Rich repeat [Carpediemonas membranifera]|eukprot:KAG9393564.1 Leucine Rich repeat [Carpediemonas membranifera]